MKRTQTLLQQGAFIVALAVSTNFQVAAASHGGGHGGGGGGGGDTGVACVTFDDAAGDTVQSDGGGSSYCNNSKNNVSVSFSSDGHLFLDTNTSNKVGAGRRLYVDFGQPIQVLDSNDNPVLIDKYGNPVESFQSTDDLDAAGIEHDVNLDVGASQGDFDMFKMVQGQTDYDVNLTFNLFLHNPGKQRTEFPIFVKLAPEVVDTDRQCEISSPVAVTCTAVDASGNPIEWYVTTEDPDNYACVDTDPYGHNLSELSAGLRSLSFGFTVTR